MVVLEQSDSGDISRAQLQQSIEQIARDNGEVANPQQTQAIVNRVFSSSNALSNGRLKRYELRHALKDPNVELSEVVHEQVISPSTCLGFAYNKNTCN